MSHVYIDNDTQSPSEQSPHRRNKLLTKKKVLTLLVDY
jgi:hypothetical protein